MFLPKIARPDLYQLDEFFTAVASLLLLLRLHVNLDGSSTNFLSVFVLN